MLKGNKDQGSKRSAQILLLLTFEVYDNNEVEAKKKLSLCEYNIYSCHNINTNKCYFDNDAHAQTDLYFFMNIYRLCNPKMHKYFIYNVTYFVTYN